MDWIGALDVIVDREVARPCSTRGEKVALHAGGDSTCGRTVGAMLSGEPDPPPPEGLTTRPSSSRWKARGGLELGAFLRAGITFYLIGDANDYTGKGLSGGRIVGAAVVSTSVAM